MRSTVLDQLNLPPFSPPAALSHGMVQTVLPYYLPNFEPPKEGEAHVVDLSDGDKLAITECRPPKWKNGERLVILIHGLAGSEDSPYIKRIGDKFYKQGFNVIKVNLRSCGPGRGLALNPYHSGRSEDTRQVILWLQKKYPKSPITQVGFSLSANITLKMAGEGLGDEIKNLDSCVAVSPPLDLSVSAYKITKLSFGIFDKFFLFKMRKGIKELNQDFPEANIQLPKKMNMVDFDNLYTAPRSGFENAKDYYIRMSSKNFVPGIEIPTLILHSMDDPVVDSTCLSSLDIPGVVDVVETLKGGHVGFLEQSGFWMDKVILNWVQKVADAS